MLRAPMVAIVRREIESQRAEQLEEVRKVAKKDESI
jgi:hypothetical protein